MIKDEVVVVLVEGENNSCHGDSVDMMNAMIDKLQNATQ